MARGVTIGQAAAYAGVTVKTVRHYHQQGLLDEPRRDSSGYRRYGSDDLLRLVQVRTLAGAGIALAEIGPMLDAGAEQFRVSLTEADQRLTERIAELVERRATLRRLTNGDRTLLPERACAVLDRLPALGYDPVAVTTLRKGLVLARALFPQHFDDYLAHHERRLDDARFVELDKLCWEAAAWDADDPRVEELAVAFAGHLLAHPALLEVPAGLFAPTDASTRYGVLNHHGQDLQLTWARLTSLIETELRSAGVPVPHQ